MSSATGASASILAATGERPALGPCLLPGMSEAAVFERLNSWGVGRDRELASLRADLLSAQAGVSGAFSQAERTLVSIAGDWRLEAEETRMNAQREAAAAMARLELVVGEARARFAAPGSYKHLRAHETKANTVCRLLPETQKQEHEYCNNRA